MSCQLNIVRFRVVGHFAAKVIDSLNLKPADFILEDEDFSSTRRGKRQYLNDKMQREYLKRLNAYFLSKVEIPRIRKGEHQEIETLINKEALLLARFLRSETQTWKPRIVRLAC